MATKGEAAATEFPIDLGGNAAEKSKELGDELEKLRQKIDNGQSSLKALSAQMQRLQQSSVVDVAAARELKTKIQEQKDAVSAAGLAMMKLGTSYESASAKARDFAKREDELKKKMERKTEEELRKKTENLDGALKKAAPTVSDLGEKFSGFFKTLTGSSGLELAGLGTLALAAALVAAGVAAVGFGVAAVGALAKFVLESGNALRTMNLLRLAFAGTERNAANLGTQVDALARKVPTAKAELNKLASELAESGLQGQTLVDTFNAIGVAAGAGAAKASAKIQEIIDRSKLFGRVAINPQELLGTGLKFNEIAESLALQMHIGVDKARLALLQGAVPLGDAAAAMRAAVEKKFGKINAAKMLDLDVQLAKFEENLQGLTSGVDLTPLLEDLKSLFALFSDQTVTGEGLRVLVEAFGKGFVGAVHGSTPIAKAFIEGLVLGALRVYLAWLNFRIGLRDTFGDSKVLAAVKDFTDKIDGVSLAARGGKAALMGLAAVGIMVATSFAFIAIMVGGLATALGLATAGAIKLVKTFMGLGKAILEGVLEPLKTGKGIEDAVDAFVEKLKNKIKAKLKIHSPSALMHDEVGLQTGQGVIAGAVEAIEAGAPSAAAALEHMIPPASSSAARGTSGAANDNDGAGRELHLHFHVPNKETAEALKEPGTMSALLRLIEEALKSAGIAVRT